MELQQEGLAQMYLPDDQGEYVLPEVGMQNFSVQGLSDVLTSLDSEVTVVQPPAEEYALLLEVTMADQPGHLHPLAFSWNSSMVLHVLKRDPHSGIWSMCKWTAQAWHTSSFMTSRAQGTEAGGHGELSGTRGQNIL